MRVLFRGGPLADAHLHAGAALADAPNDSAAAEYLGDVNALHPFFGQLARETGYRLAWEGMTREAMTGASIEAMRGENRLMAALLRAHLSEHRVSDRTASARRAEAVGVYAGPSAAVGRESRM